MSQYPSIPGKLTSGGLVLLTALVAMLCRAEIPSGDLHLFEAVEPHMGTLFRIKLYATDSEAAKMAFRAAFDRITQLDNELSDYRSDSELNRLTETAVHRPVKVSRDLFDVLAYSQELATKTNGAFDVTLGPLTHLWRESRKSGHVPEHDDIQAQMGHCGFKKMHLDRWQLTVTLDEDRMQLDVGGIAKGYAADEALGVLEGQGIHRALIAASGDLAFNDGPPTQPGWKVGVDSLDAAGQPFTRVLTIANAAVSTSGDTEQSVEDHGKRYSHIVDPRSGLGLTNRVTVTVIAPLGIEADANATALSVLGPTEGLALVEGNPRLAALFVVPAIGGLHLIESTRFHRFGVLQ